MEVLGTYLVICIDICDTEREAEKQKVLHAYFGTYVYPDDEDIYELKKEYHRIKEFEN